MDNNELKTHSNLLKNETGLTELKRPTTISIPEVPAKIGKIQLQEPKDEDRSFSDHSWLRVLNKGGEPYGSSADPRDPLGLQLRIQYHYPISQCLSFCPAKSESSLARKRNDGLLVLTTADISYSDHKTRRVVEDVRIILPDKAQVAIKHLAKISDTEVVFSTANAIYSIQDYKKEAFVTASKDKTATKLMIPIKPDGSDKWQIDEIVGGVPFVRGLGYFVIPSIKDKNLELSWPTFNNGNGITKQVPVASASPTDKKTIPSLVKYLDAHSFAVSPDERKSFVFVLSHQLKAITVFCLFHPIPQLITRLNFINY